MKRPLHLDEIFKVLDSDWLYELLPGDGQDDYILQKLREALMEAASKPESVYDELSREFGKEKLDAAIEDAAQCHSHFRTPDGQLLRCQNQSEMVHYLHESGDWEWKDEAQEIGSSPH